VSKEKLTRTDVAAHAIDRLISADVTATGLIDGLYEAAYQRQGGPICLAAARLLRKKLEGGGVAVFATGFPEGSGYFPPLPETDGPVGAAVAARALFLAFGTRSVMVTDEPYLFAVEAACRGAGLAPIPLPEDMKVPETSGIRPVFTVTIPFDKERSRSRATKLLDGAQPKAVVAIERPSQNKDGVWCGLSGRNITAVTGDLDHLVREAGRRGIVTVGIGDGGNEIGMGSIADKLPAIISQARNRGYNVGQDIASSTPTDVLVTASISNWGALGSIAALALDLGKPEIIHSGEVEERCHRLCVDFGAVDGKLFGPEPASDGVAATTCGGLVELLRHTVAKALGC
jgi:hypothetical protein